MLACVPNAYPSAHNQLSANELKGLDMANQVQARAYSRKLLFLEQLSHMKI